jgi:uncharacterized membrane protein YgcG
MDALTLILIVGGALLALFLLVKAIGGGRAPARPANWQPRRTPMGRTPVSKPRIGVKGHAPITHNGRTYHPTPGGTYSSYDPVTGMLMYILIADMLTQTAGNATAQQSVTAFRDAYAAEHGATPTEAPQPVAMTGAEYQAATAADPLSMSQASAANAFYTPAPTSAPDITPGGSSGGDYSGGGSSGGGSSCGSGGGSSCGGGGSSCGSS